MLLSGCAIGPGFQGTASGVPAAPPESGISPENDRPAEGMVTAITPELLRAQVASRPKGLPADVQALLGETGPYTIGPGDVVGIMVYDHPEITSSAIPATTVADPASVSPAPGFIVSETGHLSFPYAGTIKVQGMTPQQLESLLTRKLARVYKNPQISVRMTAFRSRRAYVEGEVRTPGLQVFTDVPMTLPEALNRAGGILPTGDRSFVTLTRGKKTTTIDLMALVEQGVDPSDIPLRNGDMVTVRNRDERKVMVMGEVLKPSTILMRNGRLSLHDALGEVGGVDLGTSDPRQIFVVRNGPKGGQVIYHLDARSATALAMADGFALEPKDVVYVDPVPLVRWSRIVNLILPSTSATSNLRGTFR